MKKDSINHYNRDEIIIKQLQEELVGPAPYGKPLSVKPDLKLENDEQYQNWVCKKSGEEILKIPPLTRYGAGVLYSKEVSPELIESENIIVAESSHEITTDETDNLMGEENTASLVDSEELDISSTNLRLPESYGLSFYCNLDETEILKVTIKGGFYNPLQVGTNKDFWVRVPFEQTVILDQQFWADKQCVLELVSMNAQYRRRLILKGINRKKIGNNLITLAVVNAAETNEDTSYKDKNALALFQFSMVITTEGINGKSTILPYPGKKNSLVNDCNDNETLSNALLYKSTPNYAIGHGCAAQWDCVNNEVVNIYTAILPTYEVPSITPDISLSDGTALKVSMRDLLYLDFDEKDNIGSNNLNTVISAYSDWIAKKNIESQNLETHYQKQALINLGECEKACRRMKQGLDILKSNPNALRAFQLMNKAMWLQQQHAPRDKLRNYRIEDGEVEVEKVDFTVDANDKKRALNKIDSQWRAFQIGFVLMSLASVVNENDVYNQNVELIWFPTGGGKTEAYLGLAAFNMLYQRLTEKSEVGVQVLMRYTLRLLTAQQLQRAATLVCALESFRESEEIPGGEFSIGLWVGSSTSPNRNNDAVKALKELNKNNDKLKNNPFLIDRCPWCAAEMGPKKINNNCYSEGYVEINKSVIFKCTDHECDYNEHLPLYIIDEEIYKKKPSLVIGTVDKFAMLAWNENIRSLFGFNDRGERELSPPKLIIQDELHLISGPLGSMVGLYEPVIEELCTDRRFDKVKLPKIVCATATTRNYNQQVSTLYGRDTASLFPPPGISADDSFFAVYEKFNDGKLKPGRKYIGINAPGLGSLMSVQVRTFSALLDAVTRVFPNDRDPWQTLLTFYNSIRELGGGMTLFSSDIPEYLKSVRKRQPHHKGHNNYLQPTELTSRIKSDQVPKKIAVLQKELEAITNEELNIIVTFFEDLINDPTILSKLNELKNKSFKVTTAALLNLFSELSTFKKEVGFTAPKEFELIKNKLFAKGIVDVCLASSIIEVGVDIDRLALMAIVGQPKTTAQYIQVSGRVGRKSDRRGLVVTLYSSAKPRDRSHYEQFISYHQSLYAQVEPSSITPWSLPAIERALGASCVAYIRQTLPKGTMPNADIAQNQLRHYCKLLLQKRGTFMGGNNALVSKYLEKLENQWSSRRSQFSDWGEMFKLSKNPVLYVPSDSNSNLKNSAWMGPTSMRNVDGETLVGISENPYARECE